MRPVAGHRLLLPSLREATHRGWRHASIVGAVLGLASLFLFRLAYGLTSEFWSEDERQIYLIGLRAFARHEWPYHGPDVVWTGSRIPGALQGALVGGPLFVWAAPEAPFVLLNLLSFGALALFAWYCGRRLPELPKAGLWLWIMTAPWVLNFSTHVVNPSYVLPAAILFLLGFLEATGPLRGGVLPVRLAFAFMGFGLAWIAQLHLSVALLPPFVLFALLKPADGRRLRPLLALVLGAALPAALLLPTLVASGLGGAQRNILLEPIDASLFVVVLARFLSFASFELPRFLGLSPVQRLLLLDRHPWLIPPVVFVGLVGLVQPLAMLLLGARTSTCRGWTALRITALATVTWVYFSYFLAAKEPWAHTFYVVFPLAFYYSLHCWAFLAHSRSWRRFAGATLILGVLVHAGLAWDRAPRRSLYHDRSIVVAAIEQRNDRLLGDRRYVPDEPPAPPPGDARTDIRVERARYRTAAWGRVALWRLRLKNEGVAAYLDIRYVIRYWDEEGRPRGSGDGVLKEIVQPGETRHFEVADGWFDVHRVRGEVEIVGAQRLIPASMRAEPGRAVWNHVPWPPLLADVDASHALAGGIRGRP